MNPSSKCFLLKSNPALFIKVLHFKSDKQHILCMQRYESIMPADAPSVLFWCHLHRKWRQF